MQCSGNIWMNSTCIKMRDKNQASHLKTNKNNHPNLLHYKSAVRARVEKLNAIAQEGTSPRLEKCCKDLCDFLPREKRRNKVIIASLRANQK